MSHLKEQKRRFSPKFEVETILEQYFNQFLVWGRILTRGDEEMAEEIVQELCLQLTLTSPDLSTITNLDGYLYTCLRNMYLSSLMRASRERLRVVCLEDFDSLEMALASKTSEDLLDRQNELLRICAYTVWRKESSKSASYLILLFFHGYHRSEVAELARLPIAAIYNKLKDARAEVRAHLSGSNKLRIISRGTPSEPKLLLSPVSTVELFKEVRRKIFDARTSPCLSEKELLAHYRDLPAVPIPISLLSHIVSCERCLQIIDNFSRRPNLEDRGPMDSYEPDRKSSQRTGTREKSAAFVAMMQSVEKRRVQILEHRPALLAIAVDGRIVAFHDVQGQYSSLSSRIDGPTTMRFVEVFSEQQVRLAQLPIAEPLPAGGHVQTQRVLLSDGRGLKLTIKFDDLGVHIETNYFDPALAAEVSPAAMEERESALRLSSVTQREKRHSPLAVRIGEWLRRLMSQAVPTSAMAAVIAILYLATVGGYMVYRHANPEFEGILERAAAVEAINPATETAHQILQLEETSASGSTIPRGTIELWQDGNGKRFMRRLYDNQNRLLAVESLSLGGQRFTTVVQPQAALSASDERLLEDGLWKRDISAVTFQLAAGKKGHVTSTNAGFEITIANDDPGNTGILSQTLVLDRRYQLVEERLQVRRGAAVEQVRFVQTVYRKERSASIPDSTFQSGQPSSFNDPETPSHRLEKHFDNSLLPGESFAKLSRLHIAILFELNQLNADVADPIEVSRTLDGYIRVTGLIANEQKLAQVKAALSALPDNNLIEDHLTSSTAAEARVPHAMYPARAPAHIEETQIGEPPATEALRHHFQIAGASGSALDADVANFTHDALQHAQRALQSAYALDRLGSVLGQAAPGSLDILSQQRWAEMVAKHTAAVQTNLQALKSQLEVISASPPETTDTEGSVSAIDNPVEFKAAASKLRESVQAINAQAGEIFAGAAESNPSGLQQMLSATMRRLPLKSASQLGSFAANLSNTKHLAEIAPDRKYRQRQ